MCRYFHKREKERNSIYCCIEVETVYFLGLLFSHNQLLNDVHTHQSFSALNKAIVFNFIIIECS